MTGRALLVYVEPTPYILGSIRALAQRHAGGVEAMFLTANLSQPWDLSLEGTPASILPQGKAEALGTLWKKVTRSAYSVVHLGGGWGDVRLLWIIALARMRGLPVFLESDTPLPRGLPLWKRAVKRAVYPTLFSMARALLPAGTRQAEYFRHYGVCEDRIVPVHMTVDVTTMAARCNELRAGDGRRTLRREFGVADNAVVFIYVGRMEPYKGVRTLLDAFAGLAKTRPQVALLVVGSGSEDAIVQAASRADTRVKALGRLNQEHVSEAYACADVAVLPSTFEPWGLVVNEAMAFGLPVIATNRVGCVDDLVRDGVTGRLVASGSQAELQSAMSELVDRATRAAMGSAARALISGWTLEHHAELIVGAWQAAEAA